MVNRQGYFYQGRRVFIPEGAEIAGPFHSKDGQFRDIVQETLDGVAPWEKGEDPIERFDLPRRIGTRIVQLAVHEAKYVKWAVNPRHKAQEPGLSPYIALTDNDGRQRTEVATLELGGVPKRPLLTRAYPGEYSPPLPWMKTAQKADGGREACIEYWLAHAYILRPDREQLSLTDQPPAWYENALGSESGESE